MTISVLHGLIRMFPPSYIGLYPCLDKSMYTCTYITIGDEPRQVSVLDAAVCMGMHCMVYGIMPQFEYHVYIYIHTCLKDGYDHEQHNPHRKKEQRPLYCIYRFYYSFLTNQ
ncbi:hypothetical protein M9435_001538 [Picochlorum sp. BPE23]|nr:hypothetical protein M9435_001538 [Picochlorum sp. BPE23]